MVLRVLFRWILNPWVIGGAILVALVLLATTLSLLYYTRPAPAIAGPATAVLNVIPVPSLTPVPATLTPTPGITPSPSVPPSPEEGEIGLGAYVQISGTGGDGLRLRAEPGLEGRVLFLAMEAEVFMVDNGPQETEGYTWWYLVAPSDEKVQGWAVANYLAVVQNP